MNTLKISILLICVLSMQQLCAQMFTAPYQAVNYQKVISNGLTLDGVDDYVQLPANVYFNGDFTFECWVKLNVFTNWARIFDFGAGGGVGTNQFLFGFVSGNTPSGYINSAGFSFPSGIELGKWTHLAITQSGTTLTGYVNGVSVLTTTITAPANVTRNSCFIGKSNYTGDPTSNMSFDEFRIWNYARTSSQILSSMNTELVGNESGLVVYYNFNTGISNAVNTGKTTVYNEASVNNSYNGTLYNSALSGFTSNWTVGKVKAIVPANGLQLYVDAGKPRSYAGSGTVLNDLSPNANNMTLYNSPSYYSENGGALSFNGANTYLQSIANSPITGANPRTVCIWYKPSATTDGTGSLFWTGNSAAANSTYGIGFSSGNYQFWGNSNDVTDATLTPTNNSWNFIAASYGGGTTIYQYLNGTGKSNTVTNPLTTTAYPFIFSKGGTGFSGRLGNIMVYDRMLGKQELDTIYNNMKLRVPDGSTAQNAAVSGLQLHIDYPSKTSDWYWIKSPSMPNALLMYVDMVEDGGGYDFYPITAGPSVNYATTVSNGGTPLGLDLVYPRSKNHWSAMSKAVLATIAASKNGSGAYNDFFLTTYGVYRNTTAGNGSANYNGKTMRSAEYGGTTNAADWRVKDGGMWWIRDATYSEPNGDYTSDGLLGMGSFSNPYNLTDLTFNDGYCCYYATGNYYLVSTNTKKGVVYDNSLLLYVDPNVAGSYSSGTTVSDLSANLNNGTLSSVSYVNTSTTPKKFTFQSSSASNISFASTKFNTTYTGKTIVVAAKMDANFGTNLYRALFGNTGNRNFNFYVYQNGSGYQLHFSAGGGWLSNVVPLVTGQWYVFAVSQDATSVNFYVNGVLVGSTTGTTVQAYQSGGTEYIGNADNFWYGEIGTTLIYKRGLTATEIMQNYNALRYVYP
jgi:hypothetical protein